MRWGRTRQDWSQVLVGSTPTGVSLLLRPLRPEDAEEYSAVRSANRHWLTRWDATSPVPPTGPRTGWPTGWSWRWCLSRWRRTRRTACWVW